MAEHRLGRQNRRREHYERFSPGEMERRRAATREMMHEEGVDALVVCGNGGFGQTYVNYLTNYWPSFVTYFVFFADPDRDSLLLAGLSNHKQHLREVSEADDVDVMLPDPMGQVAERLDDGDAADGTVGLVGHSPRYDLGLSHENYEALAGALEADLVDVTAPMVQVVSEKGEAELDRIRRAAELTDLCMETIAEVAEPGITERGVVTEVQRRLLDEDGGYGMGFLTAAPMEGAESGEGLVWHEPSARPVESGDAVTTEMSAVVGGYRSQIHRTFTVGDAPTDTYRDLWSVAKDAYDEMLAAIRPGNTTADVYDALDVIETSPYKIYDVCLHGYGNGYLPPFVGTAASNYWPGMDDPVTDGWTFTEDQVVVVQPNVVTEEETAGLQLGSAVVVQNGAPEVLQDYPLEIVEV